MTLRSRPALSTAESTERIQSGAGTMRKKWEFIGSRQGWYWQAIDAVSGAIVEQARSAFATFSECTKDAESYGYGHSADDKRAYRIARSLPYAFSAGAARAA
jgi:hypothetical protein